MSTVSKNDSGKQMRLLKMVDEIEDYAIVLLDKNGNIESWNKGAEKIKGYKTEEITGKNFRIFYGTDDLENGLPDLLISQAEKNGSAHYEGWQLRKDGTRFWGGISITAMHEDGKVIGFTKIIRDLTEKKKADDVIDRNTRQLEQKNKELEQFAYVASHDLQEPLRTVTSFAQLLKSQYKGYLDDSADRYLDYLVAATERMRVFIKDLLEYSRIGRNHTLLKMDFNKIIKSVLFDLDNSIHEANAVVSVDKLPTMSVYPVEIKQLFQNLISNSIKFHKKDLAPVIKVSAHKSHSFWQFAVQDNGIGLDEKYSEKIFAIFQRLHNKREYEGTGIGLALCKKIVELHGGKIWVVSKPNEGSIFYFTIHI